MEENRRELNEKLAKMQWISVRYHSHKMRMHGPMADPTRGQGRVLAMLKMQPEMSTRELSFILGIRPQSLNELLGKLEKGGYIVREQSEEDRRVNIVKLTDKGREEKRPQSGKTDLLDCLNDEELAAFGGCLDKMIARMEEELTEENVPSYEDWFRQFGTRQAGGYHHGLGMYTVPYGYRYMHGRFDDEVPPGNEKK